MRVFSRHDIDLIKTVQAHLRNLASLSGHKTDEPTMRIATATLRALLSEGMLQRAWLASGLGGPMTFRTYFITKAGNDAVAYCGGGDVIPNLSFSACHNAELEERTLNLRDFCQQTRIRIGKEKTSTTDIIKYVANALGATHFDPTGRAARKYDLLRRIEAGEVGQLFISKINDLNPLYHEVLSIAQAVTRSPQIKELLDWSAPKTEGAGSLPRPHHSRAGT
jgi:hypothetical protein